MVKGKVSATESLFKVGAFVCIDASPMFLFHHSSAASCLALPFISFSPLFHFYISFCLLSIMGWVKCGKHTHTHREREREEINMEHFSSISHPHESHEVYEFPFSPIIGRDTGQGPGIRHKGELGKQGTGMDALPHRIIGVNSTEKSGNKGQGYNSSTLRVCFFFRLRQGKLRRG